MAKASLSRRATAGIVFIVSGAIFALTLVLPLVNAPAPGWLAALGLLAAAIAFAILGFGAVNSTLAKVALIATAVGYLLLAIVSSGVAGLPPAIVTIAALVAGIGGLVAAIVLYVGKEIRNQPAVAFIITTAVALVLNLISAGVISVGPPVRLLVSVLLAVGLIVTGVLFRQKERRTR